MSTRNIYEAPSKEEQEITILEHSESLEYPVAMVILVYLFLGGVLGGFLLFSYMGLRDGNLRISLSGIAFFMFFGAFVGLIPAFITGAIIAWREIMIKSILSYLMIGAIGFFVTALCAGVLDRSISVLSVYPVIGGVSAIILAFCFVPKESKS